MKTMHWADYVTEAGDFELPKYIFNIIMFLMKQSLDLGTLLSNDPAKLRAFKEQVKNLHKKSWLDIAQGLEEFEIIVPCGCQTSEFCKRCGGSRYSLAAAFSPDQLHEISVFVANSDPNTTEKLRQGLHKAMEEVY